MIPIADGSDLGGSLRNPASFCNVVGVRPSAGRVPTWPAEVAWFTMGVDGPMARTVDDVALLLSVMAGPDPRSPSAIPEPGSAFAPPIDPDVRGLRVAWVKDLGLPFDPEVRAVIDGQRPVLQSLGCLVEDAEPSLAGADEVFAIWRAWYFAMRLGRFHERDPGSLKDTVRWNVEQGLALSGQDLARAEMLRTRLYHRLRAFMSHFDAFVLPTVQVIPFDAGTPYPTSIDGVGMNSYLDWMRSCSLISATGLPALSVPAGFTDGGLPVGLQIVGRYHDDHTVLRLGRALEDATGHWRRHPSSF